MKRNEGFWLILLWIIWALHDRAYVNLPRILTSRVQLGTAFVCGYPHSFV